MTLFDNFITDLQNILDSTGTVYDNSINLKSADKNKIIFGKECVYELGGSQLPCTGTLAVSSDKVFENSVHLIGNDICKIKKDTPFAKIVFVQIDDFKSDDEAFDKIKELEYVRYNFSVDGLMSRASALSCREQIRVGKSAIKNKLTFYDFGSALIKEYLAFDYVKSVDIYFVTEFEDFSSLSHYSMLIKETVSALNHILDNVLFDCSTCNLKEICDEVEGMKEIHIKKAKNM